MGEPFAVPFETAETKLVSLFIQTDNKPFRLINKLEYLSNTDSFKIAVKHVEKIHIQHLQTNTLPHNET